MHACVVGPPSFWRFLFFSLLKFSSPGEAGLIHGGQIPLFARGALRKTDFLLRWCVPHLLPGGPMEETLVIHLSQLRMPLPLGLGGLSSRLQLCVGQSH